jgi:hypothetical protein
MRVGIGGMSSLDTPRKSRYASKSFNLHLMSHIFRFTTKNAWSSKIHHTNQILGSHALLIKS